MAQRLKRRKRIAKKGVADVSARKGTVILSDFDGTISTSDLAEQVLERFARNDWRMYLGMLERGEITLEECVQRQFSEISASEEEIIQFLEKRVSFRPNFSMLVNACEKAGVPITVVSAGIDFVIKHFLVKNGWGSIPLHVAKTRITGRSIEFAFPPKVNKEASNFKDDIVISHQKGGKFVVYLGDGLSDFNAIGRADAPFAVEGRSLLKHCSAVGVRCRGFSDFREVVDALRAIGRL